jgi:hypothetical protein
MMLGAKHSRPVRRPSYAFYSLLNMPNSAIDPFDSKLLGSAVGRLDLRPACPLASLAAKDLLEIGLLSSTQGSSCQRTDRFVSPWAA